MANLQSKLYDAFDKPPEPAAQFLKWLVDAYGAPCPPRTLDVGCGPGRMLRELDRLGWPSVGMDPDPDFLEMARELDEASDPVEVRPGGFLDIEDHEAFDLIVSINGPFSYLLTVEERADALRRMHRALRPGGVLFLDVANFPWLLKNFEEFREQAVSIGGMPARRIQHFRVDFHDHVWVQIDEFQYEDPEEGPMRIAKEHRCGIITMPELRFLSRQAGFVEPQTFNGYESRQSEALTGHDMLFAAQKPRR